MSGLSRLASRIRAGGSGGLLVHFISFAALGSVAFHMNRLALLRLDDGNYIRILMDQRFVWDLPTLGFSSEMLQSLGNIEHHVNPYLIPELLLPALLGGWKVHPAETYTLLAATMFLAVYLVSRTLGFRTGSALLAAWAMPLLMFPFFGDGLIYQMLTLNPLFAWSITTTLLTIALFWRIGREGGTLAEMAAVLLLVFWTATAYPIETALTAPVGALFAIAGIAGANGPRERFLKLGFSALALALIILSGLTDFLLGIFRDTAAADFGAGMMHFFPGVWSNISVLFQYNGSGIAGPLLFVVGVVGAIAAVLTGTRAQRAAGAALLACVLLSLSIGGVLLFSGSYSTISPLYYELEYLPFYAIFAAGFIGSLLEWSLRRLRIRLNSRGAAIRLPRQAALLPFLAALPWLLVPELREARQWPEYPYPPIEAPIVLRLHKEIGLVPGADFRGRVTTMTDLAESKSQNWSDLADFDTRFWWAWGNDHRRDGLWYYGIPTLFEYSPLISPFFYRATRDLLARPDDPQMRNAMMLRRFNPEILRLFGVRFVIADAPLPAPAQLVQTVPPPPAPLSQLALAEAPSVPTLLLYELDRVNLGDYAPTATVVARDADAALAFLGSGADLRRTAAVEEPLAGPLVPASDARIVAERGGLRLSASSAGTSLLLLPFEYSHCLTLTWASPEGAKPAPRLIRSDLLLTGVLFSGRLEATLRYHTGPFHHARCRLSDEDDARRLRLSAP